MSTISAKHIRTQIFATSKHHCVRCAPKTLHVALLDNQCDFGQHKQPASLLVSTNDLLIRMSHAQIGMGTDNKTHKWWGRNVRRKGPCYTCRRRYNIIIHFTHMCRCRCRCVPEHPRNPQHTFDLCMVHATVVRTRMGLWTDAPRAARDQPRQPQCNITSCSPVVVSICLNKCGRCSKAHNRPHRTTIALCSADCVECVHTICVRPSVPGRCVCSIVLKMCNFGHVQDDYDDVLPTFNAIQSDATGGDIN